MKKYIVIFFLILFVTGITVIVVNKLGKTEVPIKAIDEITSILENRNSMYESLAFSFKILPVEPYEARKFSFMWKEKSIDESICYKNTKVFKSNIDGILLKGKHLKAASRLFDYLDVASLTLYDNKFIKINTDIYTNKLKRYSLLYSDNWTGGLPNLLSEYIIITSKKDASKTIKWVYKINDNWAVMN